MTDIHDLAGIIFPLTKRFKALDSKETIERIHVFLGPLPKDAVEQIVNQIGDEARATPTINEFKALASRWKYDYFKANGHWYGQKAEEVKPEQLCQFCFDCGIVKVKHNTPDEFLQLMKCSCNAGSKVSAKLPQFNSDAKAMFVRVAINPQWFNPNIEVSDDLDKMGSKVLNKFDEWRAIVHKSEKYWAGLGFKA
jgi:hypothetical protein